MSILYLQNNPCLSYFVCESDVQPIDVCPFIDGLFRNHVKNIGLHRNIHSLLTNLKLSAQVSYELKFLVIRINFTKYKAIVEFQQKPFQSHTWGRADKLLLCKMNYVNHRSFKLFLFIALPEPILPSIQKMYPVSVSYKLL